MIFRLCVFFLVISLSFDALCQSDSGLCGSFESVYSSNVADSVKCNCFIKYIKEAQQHKDYDKAITYSNKGNSLFIQRKYINGIINITEILAEVYYTKKNFDSTIILYKNIIELSGMIRSPERQPGFKAKMLCKTGRAFERLDYDSAIAYYHSAHLLYNSYKNSTQDSIAHVNALSMMAYSYIRNGSSQIAYDIAREAVALADEVKDNKEISLAYSVLGTIMNELNLFDEAISAFNKSLGAAKIAGDTAKYGQILNGIGLVFNKQNNFRKALQYYCNALEYLTTNKSSFQYATVCYNIVHVLCELDSAEGAEFYVKEVLENMPKTKSDEQYFGTLLAMTAYFIKKNNLVKAGEYMKLMEDISDLHKSKKAQMDYHLIKSKLLQAVGDYKKSLEYFQVHQQFKDSISDTELSEMAAEKNTIYETAKKQEEISHLRSEKEVQRLMLLQQEQQIKFNSASQERKETEFALLAQKQLLSELQSKQMQAEIQNAKLISDKVKTENDLLKKDSQLQQTKLLIQESWRNASLIFSGLFIVIALLFYNRWHTNKKYSSRLEEKNKIIEAEKEKAIDNEKYKSQFLANMSHEIRTPLHAISGMINVLNEKSPNEEQKAYLNVMQKSSENLMGIINNILDISKIEAGKIEFEDIVFSVEDCVKNVVNMLYVSASTKNIDLSCHFSDLPAFVKGDQLRLNQVLINLIGNAIKFTEKGRITIDVFANLNIQDRNKNMLTFVIADSGIGILPEKLNTIFDSFSQEEAGINRKFGGTGLGLSISKQLIELQGGTIKATSKPGHGSVFTFNLPMQSVDKGKVLVDKITSHNNYKAMLAGIKVLIVEDNSYNRLVASETLKILLPDITIDIAEQGALALDLLNKNTYRIIFMDLQMPVMDGYTATLNIRSLTDEEKKHVPIIGISANATETDRERCMEAGMNEYLTKPFHPDELLAAMYKVVTVNMIS